MKSLGVVGSGLKQFLRRAVPRLQQTWAHFSGKGGAGRQRFGQSFPIFWGGCLCRFIKYCGGQGRGQDGNQKQGQNRSQNMTP